MTLNKITIIAPPFGSKIKEVLPLAPPVLAYLAGFIHRIRPDIEIRLIDANREDVDADTIETDMVMISVLTPLAPWAYEVADRLRLRGIPVVLGGWHVTVLPEEAKVHADSVVVGEAEGVLETLLSDAENGCLKPYYHGHAIDLKGLPRPETHLLKHTYPFGSYFTQRGCPHGCSFCSVRKFYGPNIRMRPIKEVVEEVAASPYRLFLNGDDNVWGSDTNRAIELFREMSVSCKRKWWFGSADLLSVQSARGDELLKWARKANMTSVMVGWESSNPDTLAEYNASHKQGRSGREAIKKIKGHGIDVVAFIILGGRTDSAEDFDRALDLCDELGIAAHPVLLHPLPGTELYDRYKMYIYKDADWSMFDGGHAVFEHEDSTMTREFREEKLFWLRAEIFSRMRIIRRLAGMSWKGFPMVHVSSYMHQNEMRKGFKRLEANRKRPV